MITVYKPTVPGFNPEGDLHPTISPKRGRAMTATITAKMAINILIINPNSTASMTSALQTLLTPLTTLDVQFTYFTAPYPSPPSIDDSTTAQLSAEISLPQIIPLLPSHDGFVVACYSEHPLVPLLKLATSKPVLGIFEASITQSLHLLRADERFGIVTTGKGWEKLLTEGTERFLGGDQGGRRFAGVESTGLTAVELHEVGKEEVERRIKDAAVGLLRRGGVRAICLGCAGMAGMGDVVRSAAVMEGEERVKVVDGVMAAAVEVEGLIRCGFTG